MPIQDVHPEVSYIFCGAERRDVDFKIALKIRQIGKCDV